MHFDTDPAAPYTEPSGSPVPVHGVAEGGLDDAPVTDAQRAFAAASGFQGKAGTHCLVPGGDGALAAVLFGAAGFDADDPQASLAAGALARDLPAGTYRLEGDLDTPATRLAWGLGAYRFERYREAKTGRPRLVAAPDARRTAILEGVYLARDLVNTPANDLGPEALEGAVRRVAEAHGATVEATVGDDLLPGFPMVHAVGRASDGAPRVIDLTWGDADAPKVTLVGKGVTFDTGGLNIKPGASMALMKKDMGGAANTLALAHMIMAAGLPVRLRLIVGAVENAIAGNAFRPGDVLATRKGITVEIGNTDAEGRLVLGDCLALADEEAPDLLIDMATLTGAARVAVGPDLPAFFTRDDDLADAVSKAGVAQADPVWRLPLWSPYRRMLQSKVADVNHISTGGFAGSITAALFLEKFVEQAASFAHIDVFAWTPEPRPHAPVGGEAQAVRALFAHIAAVYAK